MAMMGERRIEQHGLIRAREFGQPLEISLGQGSSSQLRSLGHRGTRGGKFLKGATPIISFVRFHGLQHPPVGQHFGLTDSSSNRMHNFNQGYPQALSACG